MSDDAQKQTPMSDHIARFWHLLKTEHVHILVEIRRDHNDGIPHWDSASFGNDVAKALAATQEPINLEKRPVAWRYKNGVDEWELTDDETVADAAVNAGHDAQGLYVRAAPLAVTSSKRDTQS